MIRHIILPHQEFKLKSDGEKMKIGISTASFYPLILEESLDTIKNSGFDLIEVFLNTPSEFSEEYAKNFKEKADKLGIKINSVHSFSSHFEPYLFDVYQRRRKDMIKHYESVLNCAKIFESDIYTFHGLRLTDFNNLNKKHVIDVFNELTYLSSSYDVRLAQENVSWCMSSNLEYLKFLIEGVKNPLYFTLDIKQAFRAKIDPIEYIKVMKDKIVNCHVNDKNEESSCMLPGRGNVDFGELNLNLKAFGYAGNGIIEVYGENYKNYSELTLSMDYLNNKFLRCKE